MAWSQIRVRSPAKVNLYLRVLARREDGYHEIESLLCPVGLFDEVILGPGSGSGVKVVCEHPDVPEDASNLAARAASLFYGSLGRDPGLLISLKKNIPVGAGLGGGSGNAAAVLRALNQKEGRPFSRQRLSEMGATLGADVPFFLQDGPARARGVGEVLEPFGDLEPGFLVIVFPGFSISTGWVYKNFTLPLTRCEKNHRLRRSKNGRVRAEDVLFNDLESVVIPRYPETRAVKNALLDLGAAGALMSGSGSSVFGVFRSRESAESACGQLAGKSGGWSVFYADMLVRGG